MFTGLVQTMGRVEAVDARAGETRMRLRPRTPFEDIEIGESIAVNGVCLTVETETGGAFTVYASAETMGRTNLGGLRTGTSANLERALAMGDRLGGHMVSGHVDCLAEVVSAAPAGQSVIYRLRFPREYGVYVVEKGSVALDGISLTVNECGDDFLTVNIIPETQKVTTIGSWSPGTRVNMEADVIGKYVLRSLAPYLERAGGKSAASSAITEEFLRRNGF